uniref:Putative secreted protein n=1 Tax=Anopheles darlingi TaxID=43151 RepID=A0A2M4DJW4_ANODA
MLAAAPLSGVLCLRLYSTDLLLSPTASWCTAGCRCAWQSSFLVDPFRRTRDAQLPHVVSLLQPKGCWYPGCGG